MTTFEITINIFEGAPSGARSTGLEKALAKPEFVLQPPDRTGVTNFEYCRLHSLMRALNGNLTLATTLLNGHDTCDPTGCAAD